MQVADLKNLFKGEEKGVSPVIGVILMVAVTVILAAVIGAFVMNMGDNLSQSAPQANFNYEADDTDGDGNLQVEITHDGGDSFTDKNTQELSVNVNGAEHDLDGGTTGTQAWVADDGTAVSSYPVSAGDQVTTQDTLSSGDELRVIWTSDSGDSSQTVGSYTLP